MAFFFEPSYYTDMPGIVIVIPCYNEPELLSTLNSLFACNQPHCNVEVIVVVNDAENDSIEVKHQNYIAVNQINGIKKGTPEWLRFSSVYATNLPVKHAGVGWARKIGMDWAVSLFNQSNNSNGIILSLDADAIVEKNYLQEVHQHFSKHPKHVAATLYFEHPYENVEHDTAVVLYELYMRYYKHAIDYARFPNSLYTIGSCFAVKASAYVAQGGMNRRKAGEDFYFLHKLMPFGKVGSINTTTVYPSPRLSSRVPFGTGPALQQFVNGSRDLHYTYPLYLFDVLREFFLKIELFYGKDICNARELSDDKYLVSYIEETNFISHLNNLKQNCSSQMVFSKRFFHLFDAFKILKWLNFCIDKGVEKKILGTEAFELMKRMDVQLNEQINAKNLLNLYRALDKNNKY